MADSPAPPPAARVTFGALWELCDADRSQAESLVATYAESMRATPAPSADDLVFYTRRLAECEARAAQFLTLQKLIERCDRSDAIKAELKRLANAERAASDAAMVATGDADDSKDSE